MNKKTVPLQDVRIRITEQCNYRCFFCHDEGGSSTRITTTLEEFKTLCQTLLQEGRRDFTLTGGEPFVRPQVLIPLVQWLCSHPDEPSVTIVTNGEILSRRPDLIPELAVCRNLKLNISLHTANDAHYKEVTCQSRTGPSQLKATFFALKAYGVPFKFNAVLLRKTNDDAPSIRSLISYSNEVGATALKLVELLIINETAELYDHYTSSVVVAHLLEADGFPLVSDLGRTQVYKNPNIPLRVEITCCTCKKGCNGCLTFRADTFSGHQSYHPCMLDNTTISVASQEEMSEAYHQGKQFIRKMGEQYGSYSPSVVREPYYQPASRYLTFEVNHALLSEMLSGCERTRMRKYSCFYYQTANKAPYSVKYLVADETRGLGKIVMVKEHVETGNGLPVHVSEYIHAKDDVFFGNVDLGYKILEGFGCSCIKTCEHGLAWYTRLVDGFSFSILHTEGKGVTLQINEATYPQFSGQVDTWMQQGALTPLTCPTTQWVLK